GAGEVGATVADDLVVRDRDIGVRLTCAIIDGPGVDVGRTDADGAAIGAAVALDQIVGDVEVVGICVEEEAATLGLQDARELVGVAAFLDRRSLAAERLVDVAGEVLLIATGNLEAVHGRRV